MKQIKKGHIPWNKGKKCPQLSKKHRENISKGLKGNKNTLGKHWKLKISRKGQGKGKHFSPQTEFRKGHSVSEKVREKQRNVKLGKPRAGNPENWKMSELTKKKMSQNRMGKGMGKKNGNWKGNKRKKRQQRNDPEYKYWVNRVKKRDNNTCRLKNKDCSGYNIVHHIKGWVEYPKLRYKINNGITLCQAHHPRKRAEERKLISLFERLVGSQVE